MEDQVDDPVTQEVMQEPTTETEGEEATQANNPDEQDTEGEESADELEVEYSGNKYKVPKELAPIISNAEEIIKGFKADHTKKTMGLAEDRKAVEAEREAVRQEAQLHHEIINELSQLKSVEAELSQYQNVNWQQWQAADANAAAAGMARMMQLQNAHRQVYGQVEARKAEVATTRDRQADTMRSQALEALSKPDPEKGWDGIFDDAKRDKLTKFGREIGYTDEELAGTSHHLMIKTLHLAKIGYDSLKKSKAAATAPPRPVANPVPVLATGKSRPPNVLSDSMSTAQWIRVRNAQAAKEG